MIYKKKERTLSQLKLELINPFRPCYSTEYFCTGMRTAALSAFKPTKAHTHT